MGLDITLEKIITKKRYDELEKLKRNPDISHSNIPSHYDYTVDENNKDDELIMFKQYLEDDINTYNDWDKLGMDVDKDWHLDSIDFVNGYTFTNIHTNEVKSIKLEDIPTYDKKVKKIYAEEIGYQRKGVEDRFYDLYYQGKLTYFVTDKNMLDLLYSTVREGYKESFKKNIYDKFIKGKTFITLDW